MAKIQMAGIIFWRVMFAATWRLHSLALRFRLPMYKSLSRLRARVGQKHSRAIWQHDESNPVQRYARKRGHADG